MYVKASNVPFADDLCSPLLNFHHCPTCRWYKDWVYPEIDEIQNLEVEAAVYSVSVGVSESSRERVRVPTQYLDLGNYHDKSSPPKSLFILNALIQYEIALWR